MSHRTIRQLTPIECRDGSSGEDTVWIGTPWHEGLPAFDHLVQLLGTTALRQLGIYEVPRSFRLSVVIPVFNERQTIEEILRRVQAVPLRKEIIIVDDFSTDGTRDILRGLDPTQDLRIVYHPRNRGKGAALRTGLEHVSGDVVVIQDADLEYDPSEYPRLIEPIVNGRADVVFGSRFIGNVARVHLFWHRVANGFLTLLTNIFANVNLTDMETCYKVFRRSVLNDLPLKQDRFGIEPELTMKIARRRCRIYEVPISYAGRDYSEGKKIGFRDAIKAVYCIVRYRIAD
jgi:glycosyltransferase involved in cell wall biosynthesis